MKIRKKVKNKCYAEMKYITHNKQGHRLRTIYYYIKWRYWEWRIK